MLNGYVGLMKIERDIFKTLNQSWKQILKGYPPLLKGPIARFDDMLGSHGSYLLWKFLYIKTFVCKYRK